jgi:hypothetical protein
MRVPSQQTLLFPDARGAKLPPYPHDAPIPPQNPSPPSPFGPVQATFPAVIMSDVHGIAMGTHRGTGHQ